MAAQTQVRKVKTVAGRAVRKRVGIDRTFLATVIMLVVIGLIMLFSASYPDASYRDQDGLKYIKSQSIFALLGAVAMFVTAKIIDYRLYKKFLKPIMFVIIVLLVFVLFMPAQQGAHRWIPLGFTTVQPSEFAKLAVIIYCAAVFDNIKAKIKDLKYMAKHLLVLAIVLLLLIAEPHFSVCLIICAVLAIMFLVGGFPFKLFLIMAAVAAPIIVAVAFGADYRADRLAAYRNPFDPAIYKTTGWQIAQCLYAIGSGGLFGLGFGNSRQKYMYVSEPHNDTIFAIVCEELGLIGAIAIIALFCFLMWRGINIAMNAPDSFGAMLVTGIMTLVGVQIVLNIAVVTKLIPATGIPLPFFSAGGTALVTLMAEMGIVLNVSSHRRQIVSVK